MKNLTLGSCIRSLRKQNGMTQAQLAEKLNVTDKAVSKWERNLSYPDIALFPKLADVLGTTVNNLLRECTEEYRPSHILKVLEMNRDIRMPLHIILGFVEIAKINYEEPEMLLRYLEGIKVSGEYLLELLDGLRKESSDSGQPEHRRDETEKSISSETLEKYLEERLSKNKKASPDYDFSGKRVLVAEDMAVNREIAAEILKQTGAETEFAENGRICLDKIEAAPAGYYDLILMDLMMPEMDGLEATRRIRKLSDQIKASIPIIAMTTNVDEKDRNAAFDAGMNAFTEKPIFLEKLFEAMNRHLEKKN